MDDDMEKKISERFIQNDYSEAGKSPKKSYKYTATKEDSMTPGKRKRLVKAKKELEIKII